MMSDLTRRGVLAGIAASSGGVAFALAPERSLRPAKRPLELAAAAPKELISQSEVLIRKAGLSGDVGFAIADTKTGELLDARMGTTFMPPASTLKTITALYALDRLGADHSFETTLLATGPIRNGRLDGDLVLAGGGDPTLDTDRLAELAKQLREAGVTEVAGAFKVWHGALPTADRIDPNQPEHVSYNPAFGGINLNFNRVHFKWQRNIDGYAVSMLARAQKVNPATNVATMSIVDRKTPIFDHWTNGEKDHWSVAKRALGQDGARWLPVRYPARYAGDVFRTLARSNGIVLRPAEVVAMRPYGRKIARVESPPLEIILRGMLKYSTNLTAEVVGLAASQTQKPVLSLSDSGQNMAQFVAKSGGGRCVFKDHSGLGYDSAISPQDMVTVLSRNSHIVPLLKPVNLALNKSQPAPSDVVVNAKTGSLNFVSTLAGFVKTASGRELSFAFFSADTERRDAIPPNQRDNPDGVKAYARTSRLLQKQLIRDWAARYT